MVSWNFAPQVTVASQSSYHGWCILKYHYAATNTASPESSNIIPHVFQRINIENFTSSSHAFLSAWFAYKINSEMWYGASFKFLKNGNIGSRCIKMNSWGFWRNNMSRLPPRRRSRRHMNPRSGCFYLKWTGTNLWSRGSIFLTANKCMMGYSTVPQSFLVIRHVTYN